MAETISFHKSAGKSLNLSGFPADVAAETNLVTKAWKLVHNAFPGKVGGVDIDISKMLPRGGGLGGGSSNAACTIAALNSLFELGADVETLQKLGSAIGSDVAFFIRGGTAIGRGRGEILEQQPPCPRYWLVLVVPKIGMSTKEGYQLLDAAERPAEEDKTTTLTDFITNLYSGDVQRVAASVHNDFELVAERFEWYRDARKILMNAGTLRTLLCGSGSTVAGIVTDEMAGQRVAKEVGGILTSTRYTA